MTLVGFGGGEELLGDLGEVVERDARFIVGGEGELGVEEVAGVEVDELAVFLLIVGDGGMREAFEGGAEGGFGSAGASGDSAEFALVASEEGDDEVRFAEGVRLEDEGFAPASGHF